MIGDRETLMIQKYYRWLARRRLVNRYLYLNEVNKILEQYITSKILAGGSQEFMDKTRQELVANQKETKEQDKFVAFLRTMKL